MGFMYTIITIKSQDGKKTISRTYARDRTHRNYEMTGEKRKNAGEKKGME